MASESGESVSLWQATHRTVDLPRLDVDARADVCVVGAGIAGLSAAYELARSGRSVIVIDQARLGDGMTGRTTAHFTNAYDDRYFRMEHFHGVDGARILAASHTAAIERTAEIVAREGIECGIERVDGWLFVPPGESNDVLERELDAARRAGIAGVSLEPRMPLESVRGPALRFPDQLQLHPLEYLTGLARAIQRMGGRIHAHTHADIIEGGALARVQTEHGPSITAGAVVVATNSPVNDLAVIHTKQVAWQAYVIGARVPRGSVERALYWDTLDSYHYVRLHTLTNGTGAEDVLIVGGEDHRTGQEDEPERRWSRIEEWMRVFFPMAGPVDWRWSGEVMEPIDGVAFIGRNPLDTENVFVVTGDSGNGMTHAVIAGMLLRDLIDGRENPWESLYEPSRRSLRAIGEFVKEQGIIAREYAAWLAPGDVSDVSEIPRGEGAVVRRGLKMVAAFVDDTGVVHEHSAACPHMGCVVQWNRAETTWDCPCHGSRFDAVGRVIHGPAIVDLGPAAEAPADELPAQKSTANRRAES